jgi:hypothetical protein
MANYMISYDAPALTDYQPFYEAISEHNAAHLLESVWVINTTSSAAEVRDWTSNLLGSAAKIAVIELNIDWATRKVDKEATDWLKSNL